MKRKSFSLLAILVLLIPFVISFPLDKALATKNVWVEVEPNTIGSTATYKIHFTLEKTLHVHNWIKITFPYDTEFPEEFPEPDPALPFNTKPPEIDYEEKSIKFATHLELDPGKEGYSDIVVTIPNTVGIKNPSIPGEYAILICTQAEPDLIESIPYKIGEFDSPEIEILSVDGKVGKDRSYIEPPSIEIKSKNDEESKKPQIYFNSDILNNEYELYNGKFKLPDGQYITRITAYSELNGEPKGATSIMVKVDSIKPIIRIQEPKEEVTITSQKYFLIKGYTKAQIFKSFGSEQRKKIIDRDIEITNVVTNNKELITLKTDFKGHFNYKLKLNEGKNIVVVSCEDKAGNRTTTNQYIIIRE
ncbi:MAG: hypothetical protein PHQ76_01845 [Caldisericia bacterium]|nr:hypothetical protein [Caldisericia bacterium]